MSLFSSLTATQHHAKWSVYEAVPDSRLKPINHEARVQRAPRSFGHSFFAAHSRFDKFGNGRLWPLRALQPEVNPGGVLGCLSSLEWYVLVQQQVLKLLSIN